MKRYLPFVIVFGVALVTLGSGTVLYRAKLPQVKNIPDSPSVAAEKDASAHVTITCSGNGQIYADPDLFERAVGNLLENALRFTAEHGSIGVAVSKHNSDFEVAVHDNGSGIAAEHLPHVFDRFYRAESSRGSDGAGLGLALVKSIVDLHGGSAIIESNPGSGTTVKLKFPLPQE